MLHVSVCLPTVGEGTLLLRKMSTSIMATSSGRKNKRRRGDHVADEDDGSTWATWADFNELQVVLRLPQSPLTTLLADIANIKGASIKKSWTDLLTWAHIRQPPLCFAVSWSGNPVVPTFPLRHLKLHNFLHTIQH